MSSFRVLIRLAILVLGMCTAIPAIAADVARITNVATISFGASEARQSVSSNSVSLDVVRTKQPTSLSFRLVPVGYQLNGMRCQTAPTLQFTPGPIDASTLAAAPALAALDVTAPVIMVLDNQGGNHDAQVRETSVINVDTDSFHGKMTLLETAPNSGIFAGGVPQGGDYPELSACDPTLGRGVRLRLSFAEDDYSYGSATSQLVDPAGYVFNSHTAELVNGATVSLVDAQGRPASVFGDDGVSAYPSTVISGTGVKDSSGRIYIFSKGYYRFPLVAAGVYHLKITPPDDYVAPSTFDRTYLATLKDPSGTPFILNDASFGGAIVLDGPEPFFADIPIDPEGAPTILLTKTASIREASPGDFVQYRLSLFNRSTSAISGLHLNDTLPPGLRYQRGSTVGMPEPTVSSDGRSLDFTVPAIPPGSTGETRYVVTVTPGAPLGEAVNRARAFGSGAAISNEASVSVRLKPLLFTDAFTIIGRVTEGECGAKDRKGVPGIRILTEDGTFVTTDRDGLYHIEGIRPGKHVVQIDKNSVPAAYTAMACDADTRQAGSAISRFVEGSGGLLQRIDFQLRRTGPDAAAAPTSDTQAADSAVTDDGDAAGNRDWMTGQQAGIAMLFPEVDYNPRAPVLRVVIKHMPNQRVALTVNGVPVDPLSFDTTDIDRVRGIAISRWTGLPLQEGDNMIVARVLDEGGATVATLDRVVHSASIAAQATFALEKSTLVADGLTRPLLAVRVTDRTGHPVRAGTLVPFQIDAPYAAAVEAELEQTRQLAGRDGTRNVGRVVGDEGIAYIALQPTTQAGALHATITFAEDKTVRSSDIRGWLSASAKEWVVVGFGAGTMGYDTLKKRASGLPHEQRKDVVTDGQLAFYAKGRVKGSWLMTIAYDSDRKPGRDRGLLGTIDPDRYYTVYGDGARQGYDAPTQRKLYLRLERREFYALFGDFESGMTATQLGRYSRTLNGVKAEFQGRHVSFNGFAAHTEERYGRDEIQGNGLTGPYRLTGRNIVPNSDKMRIEVRDRLRPEQVLSSEQMTRHIDYDIDATMGTIRFRQPVLSRDEQRNPVFIVVDYETYGQGKKLAAGGRAAVKFAKDRMEIGASAIRDQAAGAKATIVGVDAKAKVGQDTQIRAEVATGGRDGLEKGRAYLAEIEHHSEHVDATAYLRSQDYSFGVGQQNLVETGTRKIGFDGRARITDSLTAFGTTWYQEQLIGRGNRIAGEARLEYRRANRSIFVGTQMAMDRGTDGEDRDSRLLTLGGSQVLLDGKLSLTGQTQIAPGGKSDSIDFPIRNQLLAGYRITDAVKLIGGYEIANGRDFTAHTAQVGFDVAPWAGAKLNSTVNQQAMGENGQRTYAQYGMSQSLPIGERWTVDMTLDASSTVRGKVPEGAAINAFQPTASGSFLGGNPSNGQTGGDFTAITMGAAYRAYRWSWNGRAEYRHAQESVRWGLTSNVLRTLGEGKTLASGLRYSRVEQRDGQIASYLDADVALAVRPFASRWSVLERLQFRHERADAGFDDSNALGVPAYGGGDQQTLRVINNVSVNYRSGNEGDVHKIEATAYYGSKWVRGRFASDKYAGYIDVIGFDLRRDMGRRFDFGVQASAQHAWSQGTVAFSFGPSAGFSPGGNIWISAGYNISGYRDRDFEDDRYTRAGPYLTMRFKFDQLSIGQGLRSLGRIG